MGVNLNILEKVDAMILSFFTKISHKFQRLTGRTNFFLAKCCIAVAAAHVLLEIANFWFSFLNHNTNLVTVVIFSFLVVNMLQDTKSLEEADDESAFDHEAAHKHNYIFSTNYILRLLSLAAALYSIAEMCLILIGASPKIIGQYINPVHSFLPMFACRDYFANVIPLPPGKSKIRELIEGFANSFRKPVLVKSRG